MVKFLIERPVAVIMTLIAFLALGIISFTRIPISLLPNIEMPEITVQVAYPDMSAGQLENIVTKPMRNQLLQVNHLQDIESDTRDNNAIIRLKFGYSTDLHLAYIETNEVIDEIMGMFPKDMPRPKVIKASTSDIPVFYLSIIPHQSYWKKNDDLLELSSYTENVLKRRIEQLPEVAMVDVSGIEYPEIVIVPDKQKLRTLNINENDIEKVLAENNVSFGNFSVDDKHYRYNVRFSGRLNSVADLGNILIHVNSRIIHLKEIAEIKQRPKAKQGLYLYNNKEALVMAIIKQSDAQMSEMKEKLNTLVDRLIEENPELEFEITHDQTRLLAYSINSLEQTLLLGLLLAIGIMFFFIRDLKSPVLIGLVIPSSLIISIFFLHLSGISINIVSLSGLILGVGMMIDNSIIVIDNITQYVRQGYPVGEACIAGTNEIIRPLISSVLTTCAVFIPLIFLSDIAGALFYDQAIAISVSLTVSLLVSIMILPAFYMLFYKNASSAKRINEGKGIPLIEKSYYSHINYLLGHSTIFLFIFLALFPAGLLIFKIIHKQFLPAITRTETIAGINWNEPVNIEESKNRIINLLNKLSATFVQQSAFVGKQQFLLQKGHEADAGEVSVYFALDNGDNIDVLENELRDSIKQNYPYASIGFKPAKNIFTLIFGSDQSNFTAKLRPANDLGLPETEEVIEAVHSIRELSGGLTDDEISTKRIHTIQIDFEKMMLYNLQYADIVSVLKSSFSNFKTGQLKSGSQFIDICIGDAGSDISNRIQNASVTNTKGKPIPLASVIHLFSKKDYSSILADKEGVFFPVKINAGYQSLQSVSDKITELFSISDTFIVSLSGLLFENIKRFKRLLNVLFISVLLLYLILAAQFESLLQPLLVLMEILFDFAGSLIILLVMGSSLNIMSAIGIIVMSGIVINDSIIKIDTINQARKNNVPLIEAIHIGGSRRFKPIIMTSLTTILALLPLIFFKGLGVELQLPLALAIIGGLLVGTLVSLYFIPMMYFILYRNKLKSAQ